MRAMDLRQVGTTDMEAADFRVPWRVRDTLAGLAVVLAATFLAVVLAKVSDGSTLSDGSALVPVVLLLLQLLTVSAVWVFGIRRYGSSWKSLGLVKARGKWAYALAGAALLASLFLGGVYTSLAMAADLDSLIPPPIPSDALGAGLVRLSNIAVIGLVGPLAEEIFFRGFMLAAMVNTMGALRGAAAGSALFAISHGDVGVMVPAFMSGLLLSWLYLKTRSVGPPFTAHMVQNLLALSLAA